MTSPLNCAVPMYGPSIPVDIQTVDSGIATGRGVQTTVIDTGAATPGTTGDRSSCILHGTAVASVIKQVAPGASIHSLRHSPVEDRAEGTVEDLVQAIYTAEELHAKIVNISMVACEDVASLRDAIRAVQGSGALVVASIGNRGQCDEAVPTFPASYTGVLAVGAVDSRDSSNKESSLDLGRTAAEYNASGSHADLFAPGGPVSAVLETESGPRTVVGGPDPFFGTSFAAPVVTGTAALVWEIAPFLDATAVSDILTSTAIAGGSPLRGSSALQVVNPQAAVEKAWEIRDVRDGRTPEVNAHGLSAEPWLPETTSVSSPLLTEPPVDYRVPIALSAVVSLVLIVVLIARALSSESRPPSGSAETTRHGA